VSRLREYAVKRIETQTLYVWQLAVHSGDARFLKEDERTQIAEKYFALDNRNYEAELVRKFGEDWRQSIGTSTERPKRKLWEARSQEICRMDKSLAESLEQFVNREDFWSRDC
jgi:predicted ABC-class ATPase